MRNHKWDILAKLRSRLNHLPWLILTIPSSLVDYKSPNEAKLVKVIMGCICMKICSPYLLKFVKNRIWFTFIIVRTIFFSFSISSV